MDVQLIDNPAAGAGGGGEGQDRDVEEEKIEIHLPGAKPHKKRPPTAGAGGHKKPESTGCQELFPAPPPTSGSRRAHQAAAEAAPVSGTASRPPCRPANAPCRPPPPTSTSTQAPTSGTTSTSAASTGAGNWEQFDEDEGDDEESGSQVSSDPEDEDEEDDVANGDRSRDTDKKGDEITGSSLQIDSSTGSPRKNSATSIMKSVSKTGKKIHGLLEPSEKKVAKKKAKKEKKKKRAEQSKQLFSKFIYDEEISEKQVQNPDETKERSSALKQFDEMQSRIAQVVHGAEENLKIHSGPTSAASAVLPGDAWATDKAGPLVSSNLGADPFTHSAQTSSQPTQAWQGFDDDFSTPDEAAAVAAVTLNSEAPHPGTPLNPTIVEAGSSFSDDLAGDNERNPSDETDNQLPGSNATGGLDLLGGYNGKAGAAVSSYSLVALGGGGATSGPTTGAGADIVGVTAQPISNYDSLIPFTSSSEAGSGVTSSVSKDDVFGLTLDPSCGGNSSSSCAAKLGSNVDLFSFAESGAPLETAATTSAACLDNVAGVDQPYATSKPAGQVELEDDDPFIVRTAIEARNDIYIKDAIDSAFGDPFEIKPFGNAESEVIQGESSEFAATFDGIASGRGNPFNNEPPLDENYAVFTKPVVKEPLGPDELAPESDDEVEEETPTFEQFEPPPGEDDVYNLYLRQPAKKKRITSQNRFWKEVCVRINDKDPNKPTISIYKSADDKEAIQTQCIKYCHTLCRLGLQQYDQYGKCHTVKLQSVQYKERVNVKADRIAPTLSDITKVRDFKGLKDLVHRPKTSMILDHSPVATEIFKFGGRNIDDFKRFISRIEDILFRMSTPREIQNSSYTKDDITVDIIDDYQLEIDKRGRILNHKVRSQVFCLAFLTGSHPKVELGLNHKKRQGKEVVGRKDIIPIKTDEWVRFHEPEFNSCVNVDEYNNTHVINMVPPDACHFEVMRFRVKPPENRELPLQLQVRMNTEDRNVHIHAELLIPGYYSNSKRCPQHPCEDIQIRFPIPDEWIYMFRTEKRFRYGSVHSSTRKAGKIKGLERFTQMAQGILPDSILEVTTGTAKYEHVYHDVIWRINRLPERNHGAYKLHEFDMRLELGPHDTMPENFSPHAWVQYSRPNSMVSRAQIRSISIGGACGEGEVDKWVHHTARYNYRVDIDFDKVKVDPDSILEIDEIPVIRDKPRLATFDSESEDETFNGRKALSDPDSSDSSDSD